MHSVYEKSSADRKLIFFLLFQKNIFPEKRGLTFMQIVYLGDNLHEMSKAVFLEK